jgi:hypothetical protein
MGVCLRNLIRFCEGFLAVAGVARNLSDKKKALNIE